MEKKDSGFLRLWRVYLLWVTACTIMQLRCVLSLNEEGELLLNWKQVYLEDVDDSLSNWNASDTSPCFWNGVKCTQGSVTVLDFSPLPFCNLVGDIYALTPSKFVNLTVLNVGNTRHRELLQAGVPEPELDPHWREISRQLSQTPASASAGPNKWEHRRHHGEQI